MAVAKGTGGRRVYALIDYISAAGLFRSDDSGQTWSQVSSDPRIDSRSWYFSGVTVDPNNPDAVYLPNVGDLSLHGWRQNVHRAQGRARRGRLPLPLD